MSRGTVIFPENEPDDLAGQLLFYASFQWEVLVQPSLDEVWDTVGCQAVSPGHMVVILDHDYTSFPILSAMVRKGCHLFLPATQKMNNEERITLLQLAEEGRTHIHFRNDLLFHPKFRSVSKLGVSTSFLELQFILPGGQNKIKEHLYNHLKLILRLIQAEPSRLNICTIPANSQKPELLHLHLTFHNGSVAVLTISYSGEKRKHNLSIHSEKGRKKYKFKNRDIRVAAENDGIEPSNDVNSYLLIKQINHFRDIIASSSGHKLAMHEDTRSFQLMEKINRRLELSLV